MSPVDDFALFNVSPGGYGVGYRPRAERFFPIDDGLPILFHGVLGLEGSRLDNRSYRHRDGFHFQTCGSLCSDTYRQIGRSTGPFRVSAMMKVW
jgi:hypothetical protein